MWRGRGVNFLNTVGKVHGQCALPAIGDDKPHAQHEGADKTQSRGEQDYILEYYVEGDDEHVSRYVCRQ